MTHCLEGYWPLVANLVGIFVTTDDPLVRGLLITVDPLVGELVTTGAPLVGGLVTTGLKLCLI